MSNLKESDPTKDLGGQYQRYINWFDGYPVTIEIDSGDSSLTIEGGGPITSLIDSLEPVIKRVVCVEIEKQGPAPLQKAVPGPVNNFMKKHNGYRFPFKSVDTFNWVELDFAAPDIAHVNEDYITWALKGYAWFSNKTQNDWRGQEF